MLSPFASIERLAFSVVILGNFNPAIFQPLWFSNNELVPKEEIENADLTIVHKQVTSFEIGKIQIEVNKNRFSIMTGDSSQGPTVRDLALGVITILEHTPLNALGLNVDMLWAFESEDPWNDFGHRLVPKQDWDPFLVKPGMLGLTVQGKRADSSAGRVQFRVEPSTEVSFGVSIGVNQHYELETEKLIDVPSRNAEAIRVLNDEWSSFCGYARESAFKLLKLNPSGEEGQGT